MPSLTQFPSNIIALSFNKINLSISDDAYLNQLLYLLSSFKIRYIVAIERNVTKFSKEVKTI